MAVFWQKGYHATSYEDLVNRMGINRASMYNTFGDKHQLYMQAL
ncbi:TetR/AcrR family transcriptional regulator, partial [Tunicatimonas sp.]